MNRQSNARTYISDEFNKFIYPSWNRNIDLARVRQIKESILDNGYIGAPIIVNEFMEVIDGQHRLYACQEANVPVEYTVKKRLRMKEAAALNSTQRAWVYADYIKAYSEFGDQNYIRLKRLMDETGFGVKTVCGILGFHTQKIKTNSFSISEEEYEDTKRLLDKISVFRDFKHMYGNQATMYTIIARLVKAELVDVNRLYDQFSRYGSSYTGKTDDILRSLNELYNFNRSNKFYFADKYRAIYEG